MKSALLLSAVSFAALASSSALAQQKAAAAPPTATPPPIVEAEPNAGKLPGESFRNKLVFNLGFGVGTLSPSQYNSLTQLFNVSIGGPASGANVNTEMHVQFLFTYYAPYWLMLRSGVEAVYFFPGETINGDSLTNYGGTAEIPIEFGGHYALLDDKLILEIAAGPAIAGFTSAGLSGSNGPTGTQLYADPTVGFDSELKAQYFLSPVFSLGLEIGYRILNTGPLHDKTGAQPLPTPVDLDLSGFRVVLAIGFDLI